MTWEHDRVKKYGNLLTRFLFLLYKVPQLFLLKDITGGKSNNLPKHSYPNFTDMQPLYLLESKWGCKKHISPISSLRAQGHLIKNWWYLGLRQGKGALQIEVLPLSPQMGNDCLSGSSVTLQRQEVLAFVLLLQLRPCYGHMVLLWHLKLNWFYLFYQWCDG